MKALLILALSFLTIQAQAYGYEYQTQSSVVVVKCKGTIDKFSVFLTSYIDPENKVATQSTLEVGYIVKVWESPKAVAYHFEPEMVQESYVAIEGAIEAQQTQYKMTMPWYDYAIKGSDFTTAITLKTGLVKGNMKADCSASLKKIKTTSKVDYNYN